MADATTPPLDSMESMPMPSEPESGMDMKPADGGDEAGNNMEGEGDGGGGGEEGMPMEGMEKKPKGEKSKEFKPKNGCQKCCGSIMGFFANDAIYGSFVGPHPVSFFCICQPCKKCVARECARPLCVASLVTKTMNFIMLGVVTLLACFFIIPWPHIKDLSDSVSLTSFYPCQGKNVYNSKDNGGCVAHAGYFMAYRCFLAFAIVMLTNCFAFADVTSTTDDPYRKRIHHGFWLYKYLYLFVLLMVFFLFLKGSHDEHGYFEYTMSIIGNIAHVFFSLFEFTLILDIVEIWAITMISSKNGWASFVYFLVTSFTFIIDIVAFIYIVSNFAFELDFDILTIKNKAEYWDTLNETTHINLTYLTMPAPGPALDANLVPQIVAAVKPEHNFTKKYPYTNCLPGSYKLEHPGFFGYKIYPDHFGRIFGVLILSAILIVVMALKKRFMDRYPFQGWLQVAVVILFDLFYLWSALFNSEAIDARPRCSWAIRARAKVNPHDPLAMLQSGNHDTYFRYTGFFHGVFAVFALLYYTFVHGPRSKTAPLSLGFRYFIAGGYDRIPVFPNPRKVDDFERAVEKLEVWDDEQDNVAQSWSMFYLMMTFGSLSIMMSMTNFTDPWAKARYNSSNIALNFKSIALVGATFTYIFMLICPCSRVYRAYEEPIVRKKKAKKVQQEGMEEMEQTDQIAVEVMDDEDEEAWY